MRPCDRTKCPNPKPFNNSIFWWAFFHLILPIDVYTLKMHDMWIKLNEVAKKVKKKNKQKNHREALWHSNIEAGVCYYVYYYFFANKTQQFYSFALSFRDRNGERIKFIYFVAYAFHILCGFIFYVFETYFYPSFFKILLLFIYYYFVFFFFSLLLLLVALIRKWIANYRFTTREQQPTNANSRTTTLINSIENSVHVKC